MQRACVAVVGSGPAGFYAAAVLLRSDEPAVHVDMIDKLPTPWGLVRSGVAPDHPKIKSVSVAFARTADHPRYRFFGNVELGRDVSRADLLAHYDAVVYAVGAQRDNPLRVPGEDLPGSIAATDVVGWYNGHPDFRDVAVPLDTERVIVVGAGNVAIDVARMFVTEPDVLATTDTADHAIEALRTSSVREVIVLARRGPLEAAFTTPELRELGEIENVDAVVEWDLDTLDKDVVAASSHTVRTNIEALRRLQDEHPPTGKPRRIVLRFARSPLDLLPGPDGRIREVQLGHNDLIAGADGTVRAVDNGGREIVEAGLVVRAVGYRAVPLPDVPFDSDRAVIPTEAGRVVGGEREYATGWIRRGPSGVIGTNRKDGQESAESALADLAASARPDATDSSVEDIRSWLRATAPELVEEQDWRAIDRHEVGAGAASGRPRVKLCTVAELLAVATAARVGPA
ncbi:MAG: FAD-dependent oxidoreductase [Sporichthyaceae bacterium]